MNDVVEEIEKQRTRKYLLSLQRQAISTIQFSTTSSKSFY